MDGQEKERGAEPPGKGESLDDAAREAVRELEKRGEEGNAGRGDIG
jgi:hypothetical protein